MVISIKLEHSSGLQCMLSLTFLTT